MSLRWVPPANGSLRMICSPGARPPVADRRRWRPAPTPASSRGAPGCARPAPAARPSAVNSAAEQSARSLMFGLNAARRSTAPISSATPARRDDEDLQRRRRRGSRALRSAPGQHERAGDAGLGPPAVGHPDRAVGLGDDRRARRPRARSRRRQRRPDRVGEATPARRPAPPITSTGDVRAGRSRCAARARPWKPSTRRHRQLVALAGVAAVERPTSTESRRPEARRAPPARPGARGPALERRRGRADRPRLAPGRPGGARRGCRRRTARRPGPARSPPACRAPRPGRRRAAARRHRRRRGPALADRRPARSDTRRTACSIAASTTASTPSAVTPAASSAARAASTSSRPEPGQHGVGGDAPGDEVGVGDGRLGAAAAVAGRARARRPALRGPTTSAPPASTRAIDPPPAPIVCTSSDGEPHREPADDRARPAGAGRPSSTRHTSVLVPPMSKVTASGHPLATAAAAAGQHAARRAATAAATTGCSAAASAGTRPPADVITSDLVGQRGRARAGSRGTPGAGRR